ncbi:MAG: cytochrome c oxidase subunit I [Thermoleophilaceae bacterium]
MESASLRADSPGGAKGLPAPEVVMHGLRERPGGWLSWLTTTDHKKIGIMYLVFTFVFFIVGGVEALIMRLQLAGADNTLVGAETYNGLLSLHGTTMIFLFIVPVLAGFGNYMVPLMIGARDMAFPRLNALSLWLLVFGGLAFYASLFFEPPGAGWTSYAPLSDDAYSPSGGIDAWIFLIHLTGLSSLIGAINFVATIHNMRAKGMGWGRMPIFIWSILIYSYLLILALPAIAAAVTMLLTDRHFGTAFFDPTGGGDPMLWQHLFWFFGHPEVYIMILPAFGVISEVLPVFARKPIFGYKAVVGAIAAIAFLGLLVWAHHMFTTPTATVVLVFFMLGSFAIAVPTGVKIFNWIATLWRGSIVFKTPLYFAVALPALFVIGGISGVILAIFPVDWQLHDSYFVVAHLHYVLFGGSVFGIFAALYYWYPKMSGRMLSEGLGKLSFWVMFVGFNLTFLVQHSAGLSGMPRRVYDYPEGAGWEGYNLASTIGSFMLGIGVLITVVNVIRSLKSGQKAGNDPWKANTLEWFTQSPPPENNFDVVPRVRSVEPMKDIRREVARSGEPEGSVAQPVASGT